MKIICDCWLMCKMRNNCTNSRIQNEFWWLIEKRLVLFLFENLNSQLMKVIEFKEYDFRIDQNSFRSIIRVKRFYWTFFYKMCSMITFFIKNQNADSNQFKLYRNFIHFFRFELDYFTEEFEFKQSRNDWRNYSSRLRTISKHFSSRKHFAIQISRTQRWYFYV